ncbi:hypothetical protein [Parahaliea aestuarii]|uniref:Uncharacterized protein n=1 Tax=Parahaliea aestuarii TaxID=1852021 RepID=A0A5C8ZWW7_9GAMM|nr:hypothetical protein [Parahaliea aestuarii]TXS92349.1 hypothetical protein FVW59_07955 [Parahaliea aestuarii]
MAEGSARKPGEAGVQRRPPAEYAEQYRALLGEPAPSALGFSARLNMLWDLSGAVPPLAEGRVISLLAINPQWREAEVRSWLQKDVLPPRDELNTMVRFLMSLLGEHQDTRHWEAFLVYGPGVVSSPVDHLLYREDQGRREIATLIFAQVTDRYRIPPSAYDAEEAFQRCLTLMYRLNIYELGDFQPGHLEPFRNFMFPRGD